MQPNQQNQDYNQPQQPNSLPYQVPDYLQIEPLPDPNSPESRKKKRRLVSSVVIVIGLLFFAVGGYFLLRYNQEAPNRNFNTMLENAMKSTYIKRRDVFKSGYSTTTLDISSNFSSIRQAKSSIGFKVESSNGKSTLAGVQTIDGDASRTKITSADDRKPTFGKDEALQLGKWYDTSVFADNSILKSGFKQYINTPLGIIIFGNFNSDQRKMLGDLIRSSRPYQILSYKEESIEGKKRGVYSVKIQDGAMNGLVKKAKEFIGDRSKGFVYQDMSDYTGVEMQIDLEKMVLRKIVLTSEPSQGGVLKNETIDYSYPVSDPIADMESAK